MIQIELSRFTSSFISCWIMRVSGCLSKARLSNNETSTDRQIFNPVWIEFIVCHCIINYTIMNSYCPHYNRHAARYSKEMHKFISNKHLSKYLYYVDVFDLKDL